MEEIRKLRVHAHGKAHVQKRPKKTLSLYLRLLLEPRTIFQKAINPGEERI
jgi:hypothetical protein